MLTRMLVCVGTDGILECKFLSENAHRTNPLCVIFHTRHATCVGVRDRVRHWDRVRDMVRVVRVRVRVRVRVNVRVNVEVRVEGYKQREPNRLRTKPNVPAALVMSSK